MSAFWLYSTAMKPSDPTAAERLAEIAEYLAQAVIRMRARMSSQKSAELGEISLDCSARRSGPEAKPRPEVQP
jgi:hypothetical protein